MSIRFTIALIYLLTEAFAQHARYRGHWEKTWGVPTTQFSYANYGFAFSGHADVDLALRDSNRKYGHLQGRKILTIGGGNSNGRWTLASIRKLNYAIQAGRLAHYHGIAYDIEEGDSGLIREFLRSFQVAKAKGFFVVVTISKTAPYGVADAYYLMWYLIHSRYIDVISPIMYPSGQNFETCADSGGVDYSTLRGVPWEWYRLSYAAVVPSLWRTSLYSAASAFLRARGISTDGYIAWCA